VAPASLTEYRVVIASPGGLPGERRTFRDVISTYNDSDAQQEGVHFVPVGWEDTLGSIGRPQSIINEEVRSCDYFVLLLWDRWGSPPDTKGPYTSGTEEEFDVAKESLADEKRPMKRIAVFFKAVDERALSDPGPQLERVLTFRKNLEAKKELLFETFDTVHSFSDRTSSGASGSVPLTTTTGMWRVWLCALTAAAS
jgi:hypothetical protein